MALALMSIQNAHDVFAGSLGTELPLDDATRREAHARRELLDLQTDEPQQPRVFRFRLEGSFLLTQHHQMSPAFIQLSPSWHALP